MSAKNAHFFPQICRRPIWSHVPIVFFHLITLLLILSATYASTSPTIQQLQTTQARINLEEQAYCYPKASKSRDDMLAGRYDHFGLKDMPTLVYPFCLHAKELGNRLGNYFAEVTCAAAAGLHFVAVHKTFDLHGSHSNVTGADGAPLPISMQPHPHGRSRRVFLDALPDVVLHPNPVGSLAEARTAVTKRCPCGIYCWTDPRAPWVNHTDIVRSTIRTAIKAYLDSVPEVVAAGTLLSPDTDISNAAPGTLLPIVPDVAIQYRCGDNIGFNYMYGLLPFFAFPPRIPADARTIYVLSDHPSRSAGATYSSRCQTILQALFEYLRMHFPRATVVVKRGGDMFMDYARLTFSNVTVCSASTYCLWPALAHDGVVHYPLTSLVGNADNMELAARMTTLPRSFRWINDPLLISDLRKFRPWTNLLGYLRGETPRPEGT